MGIKIQRVDPQRRRQRIEVVADAAVLCVRWRFDRWQEMNRIHVHETITHFALADCLRVRRRQHFRPGNSERLSAVAGFESPTRSAERRSAEVHLRSIENFPRRVARILSLHPCAVNARQTDVRLLQPGWNTVAGADLLR